MKLTLKQKAGANGEVRARRYLERHGLRLITRNYRCRRGELDLIFDHGGTVVVVEVRRRTASRFGNAADSINTGKQRKIIAATRHLLSQRHELRDRPVRFDVVTIDDGHLHWIADAFRPAPE